MIKTLQPWYTPALSCQTSPIRHTFGAGSHLNQQPHRMLWGCLRQSLSDKAENKGPPLGLIINNLTEIFMGCTCVRCCPDQPSSNCGNNSLCLNSLLSSIKHNTFLMIVVCLVEGRALQQLPGQARRNFHCTLLVSRSRAASSPLVPEVLLEHKVLQHARELGSLERWVAQPQSNISPSA